MELTWKYLLFLIWLSYLLISAMLLFTRGFLLNKNVLNFRSSCESLSEKCEYLNEPIESFRSELIFNCIQNEMAKHLLFSEENAQFCMHSNTKVILLLIDALRFDFIAKTNENETIMPYHNKLTVINDLLGYNNARLYKFIADPPTTTMQRINGLMTGSLPTFVDVGSNFASSEINEDNLIDQIVTHNKSVVFMGDDTWINLFPGRFLRSYPYPSFNVWDLDTVDNGVKSHLFPEMKKNDWDLLVAHFLGVDHCGHRYGPDHPEMSRKLSEMNDVIKKVVAEIGSDTVLIVVGDHGMTETGDHGGTSYKEVTSAMFVYSPNKNFISGLRNSKNIRQIDLTPTLSALLGIPIPFSNLGTIILEILPAVGEKSGLETNWNYILSILWSNVLQTTYYIQEYSKRNSQFSSVVLSELLDKFQSIQMSIEEIKISDDLDSVIEEARKYLKSVLEMCEGVWIQFDSFSMSRGLVLMFLTVTLMFILIDGMPTKLFHEIMKSNFLIYGFSLLGISALVTHILYFMEMITNLELSLYFATSTASMAFFSIVISFNWHTVANTWHFHSRVRSSLNIMSRVMILLTAFGLFSNSYIIEECSVSSYLLLTTIWVSVLEMKPDPVKKTLGKIADNFSYSNLLNSIRGKVILFTVGFNILIRLSWFYWQCREEQTRKCYLDKTFSKSSLCMMTILAFAIFITFARYFLRSLGNLVGFSPSVFMSRYSPTISVVCCGCYWVLHGLPTDTKSKLFLPWQLQLLPRIVLCTSVISIVLFYIQPLSVYYVSKRTDSSRLPIDNLIPALFHHLKDVMIQKTGSEMKGYPIVYGLATVYSAAFINIAIFMSLLSALLLGESRALVVIILLLSMGILSVILAAVRHNISNGQGDLFSVPWWAILCWGLSSIYFFYGTGHQATFAGIQWEAAFLLGDIVSTLMPGALVIANTFISQILHALLLPVLYITPFTLGVVWPKSVAMCDPKKGELLMFEQDALLRKGMFTLAVRYILFHGFRVFISMLAACIHSRHLMVWKIFAPKLIFESIGFLITLLFVVLGFLLVERISTCIEHLIKKIEQDNR